MAPTGDRRRSPGASMGWSSASAVARGGHRGSGDRATSRIGQAPPSSPRGVRRGPQRGLTARALDGGDPGYGRGAEPSVGRRPLGHPTVERPDRDHDPWRKTRTTRTPPSPSRSRRGRDHDPDGIPVTTPARTQLDLAGVLQKHQLQQAINEAERLRLEGPQQQTTPDEARHGQPSARSRHRPTPEETSRPASPPSSMTAVSRAPQTNVLIEGIEVDFAWPDEQTDRRARQLGVPRHTRRLRARSSTRPPVAAGLEPSCASPGATWMSPAASRPSSQRSSSSAAPRSSPGPCRRRRTSSRGRSSRRASSRSLSSVVMMRAPVIPNGWPSAIAPPNGLSFSSSMPHSSRHGTTWAANASLSSTTSMSLDRHAGLLEHVLDRRDRAEAHDLGADRARPRGDDARARLEARAPRAFSSDITSTAAAPSLSGQALPAVTVPSGLKAGLSSASFSTVVPGRGPSSS